MKEVKDFDGLDIDTIEKIAEHYKQIIDLLGEDPNREGLKKTPMRAAKAMAYLTNGYRKDASKVIKSAIFNHDGSKVVVVKDIEFYSLCEHHILPFYGKISIGYIPSGKIVGLSKIARIVEVFSRRLQVQERLTQEVCSLVAQQLEAKGVIVVCEGAHMCMRMRGVEKENSLTQTIEYTGEFSDVNLRREFFDMLR